MKLSEYDMLFMFESESDLVLSELASYEFLSEDIQKSLYSKGIDIARILAKNVNLADSIQQLMLNDASAYGQYDVLKYILAKNPSISSSSQARLLSIDDSIILKSLGSNPGSNETTLWYVFHNGYFQSIIDNTSKLPTDLEMALAKKVPESTARREHLHVDTQILLSKNEDVEVRVALASNRNIDYFTQLDLIDDKDTNVKCALASNEKLHRDFQYKLAKYKDDVVKYNLALNVNLDAGVIQFLQGMNYPVIHALLKIWKNRL